MCGGGLTSFLIVFYFFLSIGKRDVGTIYILFCRKMFDQCAHERECKRERVDIEISTQVLIILDSVQIKRKAHSVEFDGEEVNLKRVKKFEEGTFQILDMIRVHYFDRVPNLNEFFFFFIVAFQRRYACDWLMRRFTFCKPANSFYDIVL